MCHFQYGTAAYIRILCLNCSRVMRRAVQAASARVASKVGISSETVSAGSALAGRTVHSPLPRYLRTNPLAAGSVAAEIAEIRRRIPLAQARRSFCLASSSMLDSLGGDCSVRGYASSALPDLGTRELAGKVRFSAARDLLCLSRAVPLQ